MDFGDATHWSLSSGGPAQPNSPMWTDDVVFDVNSSASAYTVTISSNAPCTNITIGNPLSGSVTIKNGSFIYGNLTIAAGAIVTSFLPLMKGVGGIQNVQSNGCAIGNLGIYSTSTVMLLDDLLVPTGNFELTNGNFDANGHNMTVSGFATDGVCTNSHIYLRSGIINFSVRHFYHTAYWCIQFMLLHYWRFNFLQYLGELQCRQSEYLHGRQFYLQQFEARSRSRGGFQ